MASDGTEGLETQVSSRSLAGVKQKPSSKLKCAVLRARLAEIKRAHEEQGIDYQIWDETFIRREPKLTNLKLLAYHLPGLFHYGVEVNGLHYNNDQLQRLRRQHGEDLKVSLKYYEDDLGYIHVFDPLENLYFKVQAIYFEYAHGLRLVQHQAIRSALREQQKDPDHRELLLQNKQELQDIVATAIHHNKMGKRKRQAVLRGKDICEELPDQPKPYRVYLVGDADVHWMAAMICPCGCGDLIQLATDPGGRPRWNVRQEKGEVVTLHPSVHRKSGCKSHFFLKHGRITWC